MLCGYLATCEQPALEASLRESGLKDEVWLDAPEGHFWLAVGGSAFAWAEAEQGLALALSGDPLIEEGGQLALLSEAKLPLLAALDGEALSRRLAGNTALCRISFGPSGATLELASERLGHSRLFVCQVAEGIFFSTELRHMLKVRPLDFDQIGLAAFLNYSFLPGGLSLLSRVESVPRAEVLRIAWPSGARKLSVSDHFNLTENQDKFTATEAYRRVDEVGEQLEQACAVCGSLPSALMFSGGIDSTALAVALSRAGQPRTAYTLGKSAEDSVVATTAALASQLGLPHQVVMTPQSGIPLLIEKALRLTDQPCCDGALPYTLPLIEACREELPSGSYLIDGTGAGALFSERSMRREFRDRLAWLVHRWPSAPIRAANSLLSHTFGLPAATYALAPFLNMRGSAFWLSRWRIGPLADYMAFSPSQLFEVQEILRHHTRAVCDRKDSYRSLMRLALLFNRMGAVYNARTSLLAEPQGLRLIAPFMSLPVARAIMRVPYCLTQLKGEYKYPLQRFVRSCLPDYKASKQSLTWSLDDWLAEPAMRRLVHDHLGQKDGLLADVLPPARINRLLALKASDKQIGVQNFRFLFGALSLALWADEASHQRQVASPWG